MVYLVKFIYKNFPDISKFCIIACTALNNVVRFLPRLNCNADIFFHHMEHCNIDLFQQVIYAPISAIYFSNSKFIFNLLNVLSLP